jgi:HPt (histidine-containing phosphotransfer) domain-containing protein
VHDLFQELENRYFLIYNDQKRLPDDDIAWDSIGMNEPELRAKIDDLTETAKRPSFAATDEARWAQQLDKVKTEMRVAVEEFNLEKLQDSTRLLYRVLNRQPSRINAQLVATASALRLDALEKAMMTITGELGGDEFNLEAVHQIQEGVQALAGLDERLSGLVREHNAWQELDDELRRVEGSLDQDIEELQDSWVDLEPLTRKLYGNSAEEWAVSLQKMASSLEQALNEGAIANVRRLFRRLRSQVSRRFRRVDFELLTLCQNLQKVGESLDILLRNFK